MTEGAVPVNFKVEADDLDSYAGQVGRAAEDMQATGRYGQENSTVGVSNQGLLELIIGAHRSVVEEVKAAMTGAESVLRAAQGELSKSAAYYRTTDRSNVASLDATYPPSKR